MSTPIKMVLIILVLGLAGGAGWYVFERKANPQTELVLNGNVEVTESSLGFRIPGRLIARFKDEGDLVSQGELLAELDDGDEKTALARALAEKTRAQAALDDLLQGNRKQQIREAEQAVAKARAGLNRATADLDLARMDFKRFQTLYNDAVISKQEFDRARTAFVTAQKRVDEYRASVRSARAHLDLVREGFRSGDIDKARAVLAAAEQEVKQARLRLSYTRLYAPFAGTVLTKVAEPGEYLGAGSVVLTMADLSRVFVRAFVPEPQLVRVKQGDSVKVSVDGLGDTRFTGQVGFIADEAEFTPKTVQTPEERIKLVYRIKVYVDNPQGLLKAGMPARVHIPLNPGQ
ncbi:efflux RND transporter periplasmic adaptor subunit [Desulfoplanes formicivorans]|uniref:Hemolysin secretion protein D n=1 Tax=Desulfoplanes formicivorans TaxID=1592317 RepID=A0A194AEJ8_9BACT|nr:efflux RND transporter periplasmic adaptor subunit [Desulfoplanes formicivorans]GAU08502.1 hemolysin secretion protein D [Desulfoplanes formicivorans]